MSAVPAAALLAALAIAALLATSIWPVALICAVLLVAAFRAPAQRRWPYLIGTLTTALLFVVITPFVGCGDRHARPLEWADDSRARHARRHHRGRLRNGLFQGLRLAAVGLAFAVYALSVDHDRLLAAAGWARRSTVAVGLATRLVPLLERDARDLRLALRGRGVELGAVRQLSPLLAGSLERGLNLAEAMEARGYGRADRTRAPRPPWTWLDYVAIVGSVAIVVAGALWL